MIVPAKSRFLVVRRGGLLGMTKIGFLSTLLMPKEDWIA
jgi:hypothetical protein